MTRADMINALRAIEARLDSRVTIVRVVVDENGEVIGRIPTGSFHMPSDWKPPTTDELITRAKGSHHD
jgi:hypothetical protein